MVIIRCRLKNTNLDAVVLNTNLYYTSNLATNGTRDPARQLEWLDETAYKYYTKSAKGLSNGGGVSLLVMFLADTYTCPILGPMIPLFWMFQTQSGLPNSLCADRRNIHSLRSTSGATHCQPLDNQHCGVAAQLILCPRILLCDSREV